MDHNTYKKGHLCCILFLMTILTACGNVHKDNFKVVSVEMQRIDVGNNANPHYDYYVICTVLQDQNISYSIVGAGGTPYGGGITDSIQDIRISNADNQETAGYTEGVSLNELKHYVNSLTENIRKEPYDGFSHYIFRLCRIKKDSLPPVEIAIRLSSGLQIRYRIDTETIPIGKYRDNYLNRRLTFVPILPHLSGVIPYEDDSE